MNTEDELFGRLVRIKRDMYAGYNGTELFRIVGRSAAGDFYKVRRLGSDSNRLRFISITTVVLLSPLEQLAYEC